MTLDRETLARNMWEKFSSRCDWEAVGPTTRNLYMDVADWLLSSGLLATPEMRAAADAAAEYAEAFVKCSIGTTGRAVVAAGQAYAATLKPKGPWRVHPDRTWEAVHEDGSTVNFFAPSGTADWSACAAFVARENARAAKESEGKP